MSGSGDYWEWYTPFDTGSNVSTNLVFAGPSSGLPAPPTFRSLVLEDLPSGLVVARFADGTVPAGSKVENTTLLTTFPQIYSLPANLVKAGSIIRVRGWGSFGTNLAGTNNLTTKLNVGSNVVLSATTLLTNSRTNCGWRYEADLFVTAIGGSGSVEAQGMAMFANAAAGAKGSDVAHIVNTAAITGIPFNTALSIALSVQWGAASLNNTITLRGLSVEVAI
jgi:hypothetical protein